MVLLLFCSNLGTERKPRISPAQLASIGCLHSKFATACMNARIRSKKKSMLGLASSGLGTYWSPSFKAQVLEHNYTTG
jgi:hypothetical protein